MVINYLMYNFCVDSLWHKNLFFLDRSFVHFGPTASEVVFFLYVDILAPSTHFTFLRVSELTGERK